MAVQVAISWFGYRAIAAFERWTVPPTILMLVAMSVVAWFGIKINWGYAGPAGHILDGRSDGRDERGHDGHRHRLGHHLVHVRRGLLPFRQHRGAAGASSTSRRCLGQFIPVVWLGVLGATLATKNGAVDPGALIVDNFGALAIPVLLLVVHGPIATNILNIYTFSVAAQALDITISRRKLSLFVGVFALAAVVFFIFQEDFATVLDTWLIGIVAWVAAWGGIMLVHYYWIEKRGPSTPTAVRRRRHQAPA